MKLSVVIIALNEEENIADCLDSAKFADEILVCDGASSDRTVEIATAAGARVMVHPFDDFSSQKNRAVEAAQGDWVFVLDADERIPRSLGEEIRQSLEEKPAAYAVGRDTFFFGKHLRYGDSLNDFPVRLWPKGRAHFVQPVHERIVTDLPIMRLTNRLTHYSTRDEAHHRQKVDCYVPHEIKLMRQKPSAPHGLRAKLRPVLRFLDLWVLKRGCLDGKAGFQYAWLSARYESVRQKRLQEAAKKENPSDE